MREIGMTDSDAGIEDVFEEIAGLSKKCKFSDCTHTHEPGCAVLKAIKSNEINESKYLNYLKLKREAEYYKETELERKRKDRQFGKYIKKTLEQKKKFKSYL
jgi:ribosome biogenesis GTPase